MQNAGRSVGRSLQDTGRSMTRLGTRMSLMAAPMLAAFAGATHAAIEFESAFAGVIKTVDASDEELVGLRRTIREMATDATNPLAGLEGAHVTLARIMELGGQLGVPTENLEGFTQVIGELTLATDLTAESASMMLGQFASITGMGFEDFDRLGSVIVELGNNMATTESDIVQFMQRLAGAGSSFGLTEANIAALAAAMSSVGLNAEAGGTAMTQVFTTMSNAVVSGGEDLDRFAQITGFTADQFAQSWENEPIAALEDFVIGLGEMDAATREQTLADLGLDGIRVADVLRRLSNESEGFSDAITLANEAWNENNALTNEAQQRFQTTEAQLNLAKNTIRDLAIELGGALLPVFNDLLETVRPFIRTFTDWVRDNPDTIRTIARLAAAFAAVGAVLVPLGMAVGALGGVIAAVFSPLGIAIGLVAALAFALKDVVDVGDILKTVASSVQNFIQGALRVFDRAGIEGLITFLEINLQNLAGTIREKASDVFNSAKELGGQILQGIRDALPGIPGWVEDNIIQPIVDNAGTAIDSVDWSGVGQDIMAAIGSVLATFGSWATWIGDNILTPLVDNVSSAVEGIDWAAVGEDILIAIGTALGTFGGWIDWISDNVLTPLVDNVSAAVEGIDWAAVGEDILGAIGDALSAYGSYLTWLTDNVFTPLVNNAGAAVESVDWGAVGSDIMAAIGSALNAAIAFDMWLIDNIFTPLINHGKAAIEGIDWESVGAGIVNAIGDGITMAFDFVSWLIDSIFSPMTNDSKEAADGIDWGGVASVIMNAIASAVGAVIDFIVWVGDTIILPMISGAISAILEKDWSEVASSIFAAIGSAIVAVIDFLVWMKDNVISPLLTGAINAVAEIDWGGLPNAIFDAIKNALPDIGQWVQNNIIQPIADALSGFNPMDLVSGGDPGEFRGSVNPEIAQRFGDGQQGGTPWTGSGSVGQIAGFHHMREAVVPAHGMRVVPSPRGLMLQGGGAGGGGVNINGPVNVYGVQNVEQLYDQLARVGKQRSGPPLRVVGGRR